MDEHNYDVSLRKNEDDAFQRNEKILQDNIDRERFYDIMEREYCFPFIDISKYIDGGVYADEDQHMFNIALRAIKHKYNIDIISMILFMEHDIQLPRILKFIDGETEWVLKVELSKRYNIPLTSNFFQDSILTILDK
jgi:hypothetical protein